MAQNSRRGRSGRRRQGGGNNPNRSLDSQGPEVKIRGTAQQVYDKYVALARDAFSSGDRVRGESLQQHAEHYYRMLQAMQPKEREQDSQESRQDDDTQQQAPQARDRRADGPDEQKPEPIATRSSNEEPKMNGSEQAATDTAQGTGAEGTGAEGTGAEAATGPEAPSSEAAEAETPRPRRRRSRRKPREDDASGEGAEAPAREPEDAPAA